MTDTSERAAILDCMAGFIAMRSGIDSRDYFSDWRDRDGVAAFKADQRSIARDGREARQLLAFVRGRESITATDLRAALRGNFSGRLSWDGAALDYTPGQYGPTEYRTAACAVLAGAIRDYWRADGNDWRKLAKGQFGRGIASRWFS